MSVLTRISLLLLGLGLLFICVLGWRVNPLALGLSTQSVLISSVQPRALSFPAGLWIAGSVVGLIGLLIVRTVTSSESIPAPQVIATTYRSTAWFIIVCLLCSGCSVGVLAAEYVDKLRSPIEALVYAVAVVIIAIVFISGSSDSKSHAIRLFSLGELLALVVAVLFFCVVYGHDLNSWRYSFIGDEYIFFTAAQSVLQRPLNQLPWLEACGVYCGFPWFTSVVQGGSMYLFGNNNFGWRMATVVLTAACIPALYIFLRSLAEKVSRYPKLCAALGCFLFFSLEPTQVWAKIGKPHAVFLPPILFSLGALAAAQSTGRIGLYGFTGLVLGLGLFFTPVGPSLAFVCIVLFQLLHSYLSFRDGRISLYRSFWVPMLVCGLGALVGAMPILVQREYFVDLARINLQMSEAVASQNLFLPSTLQAFFSFLSFKAGNHFLSGNICNVVCAMFILSALGMLRSRVWPNLVTAGLVLLMFSILVGGMSQYGYPPPSRIHLMGVPFAILATLGVAQVLSVDSRFVKGFVVLLVGFSLPLSYLKMTEINPYTQLANEEVSAMKALQESVGTPVALFTREKRSVLEDTMIPNFFPSGSVLIFSGIGAKSDEELRSIVESLPATAALVIPEAMAPRFSTWLESYAKRVRSYPAYSKPVPDKDPSGLRGLISRFLRFSEGLAV